jgi:transposase
MTLAESLLENSDLKFENENLRVSLLKEKERRSYLESEYSRLFEIISEFKRHRFGSRSEGWESQEQMKMVFNEVEVEAKKEEESEVREIKAHKRKVRGHRKALPKHLNREVVKIELPPEELKSESGEPLKIIGWEISERLKYEPSKMTVLETHRAKYGIDTGDYVKTAPPVASVIPKGIATPELLASIITGKFADGLPLYRLEEIFARSDVELSRGTMARWMIQVAKALTPIRNVFSDKLHASYAISCDETSMQVLKEKDRSPQTKSWMIARMNTVEDRKVVLFDYSISRSGATMKDLFAGYQGRLLCDGLESYSPLESEELVRFGCNMHSRRKFEQAAKNGAKSGISISSQVMEIYKKIYDHEEELANAPPEEKIRARNEKQRPLFEEIRSIVKHNRSKVPDKSKLGQAFRYFENEYKYLTRYLDDGYIGPDNSEIERTIRKFAIGRNNWLFADTPDGADASALLYSLVITAKINGVNPYKAITQILTEIPMATTIEDYERLAEIILTPKI